MLKHYDKETNYYGNDYDFELNQQNYMHFLEITRDLELFYAVTSNYTNRLTFIDVNMSNFRYVKIMNNGIIYNNIIDERLVVSNFDFNLRQGNLKYINKGFLDA